jgi:hypothetical protein
MVITAVTLCFSGCGTAKKVVSGVTEGALEPKNIKSPVGWPHLKKGMTKEQVVDILGEPDSKRVVGQDEHLGDIEEWMYVGRYPGMPLDLGYVQKSRRLIFKGNALTDIYREDDLQ